MSRRIGYLSPDYDEDKMMVESRRRSGRTGRFVRSRYDDDERGERRGRERMERRGGYSSRFDEDEERMGGYGFESRRRGRGYRSEMRDNSDGRHGSDRDGYD